MKFLIKYLFQWFTRKSTNPKYRWLLILGGLFYMLSPFDLSPDIFPVVGWLDDAMVMSMLVSELTNMLTIRENQMNLDIDPADVTIDVKATPV
jgi:uncharacterized membrane protein YkvA (DUF1232 family)